MLSALQDLQVTMPASLEKHSTMTILMNKKLALMAFASSIILQLQQLI
jgi:hypothetical protein